MPVIEHSAYQAPLLLKNNHIQTVLPSLFRKVRGISYTRERINTPDGDFIDLDFSPAGPGRSGKAVIISHGLEGDSGRPYMLGMAKAFNRMGWDSAAFNFRGCSGEPNRTAQTYHSGRTDDLDLVVEHIADVKKYSEICLVGFSLGANLTLKYAGEKGGSIHRAVKSAVGISAPCDLASSAAELHRMKNYVYAKRFLATLIEKMKAKEHLHPQRITRNYTAVKTLKDFDDMFTGPLNGFRDARDYWEKCSSRRYISGTAIPALILNAADDPILGKGCFPYSEAEASRNLFLEVPANGGHVGFITLGNNGEYWHETRTVKFAEEHR